jgi:thioredoxin-like negative regulator of GroEL
MQIVNFPQHLIRASEPVNRPPKAVTPPANIIRSWLPGVLPGVLLVIAIIASTLLGTSNKPGDELDWLSRLANNGDAGAQLQLGLAYRDGQYGLTPDAKTGLYWLKQSAAGGNAYAEDAIGSAYAKGQGTAQDTTLAEQWWRKAIKDGDHDARIHLADALIQAGQTQEANRLLM